MKILITSKSFGKYDVSVRDKLISCGFELIDNPYGRIMNESEFAQAVKNMDAIILGTENLSKNVLHHANKLKFISRYGVGIDNMDLDELSRLHIDYAITRNCNNHAVADYTIGLILDALRGISYCSNKIQKGIWEKKTGFDLYKKTVGVIGLGSIGKNVAKRLTGFDCKIMGYDIQYDEDFCQKYNIKKSSLEEIFCKADIITLHVPALPNDKALIGKNEIDKMKQNVVLINTARNSLIDAEYLIKGLENGKIFAAASDAQLSYAQINSSYQHRNNFILTPHNAAVSVEASINMSKMAVDNILKYFKFK